MAGQEIGTGYVTLLPSTRGFSRGVQSELTGTFNNAESHGSKSFSGLWKKVTGWAAAAAVTVGGYFSAKKIFGGGIDRLLNIEDAQAKLKGLGYDTVTTGKIMTNALSSVEGTFFNLDEAAGVAATAVAAGVRPGTELAAHLGMVANAATLAGSSMTEMGGILGKVATRGRVSGREIAQLQERNIPILKWLADEYGVTAGAMEKMVSRGEVDSETFARVMQANLGDAALAAGDTTRGALARLGASLSRIGANLLGGVFPMFKPALQGIIDLLKPLEKGATKVGEAFGAWVGGIVEKIKPFASNLKEVFTDAGGGFDGLLNAAQVALGALVGWLAAEGVQMILDTVLSGRERMFDAALKLFPAILDAAMQILPEIVGWLAGTAIPALVQMVVDLAPALISAIGELLPQLVTLIVSMVPALLGAAVQLFTALIDAVVTIAPVLLTTLVGQLPGILGAILGMVPQLLNAAISLFTSLVQAVLKVLPDLLKVLLGEVLPQLLDTVLTMIPELLTTAIDLFVSLVEALVEVLPQLIDTFFNVVLPAVLGAVIAAAPKLGSAAVTLFQKLTEGLEKIAAVLLPALVTLIAQLIAKLPAAVTDLYNAAVQFFAGFLSGITAKGADVLAWAAKTPSRFISAMGNLSRTLVSAGRDLIAGFLSGIKDKARGIADAVLAPIKNAVKGVKDFLGIRSPSRLFAGIAGDTFDGFTGYADRYGVAEVERVMGRVQAAIEINPAEPAAGHAQALVGGPSEITNYYLDGMRIEASPEVQRALETLFDVIGAAARFGAREDSYYE